MWLKLITRVITAQSIITKVNKSLYVTIGTSSFQVLGSWHIAPSALWVSILYFQCVAGLSSFGSSDLNQRNFAPVRFIRITYETVDLIKSLLWRFAVWSGVFWYFCKQFNLFYRFLFSGSIEFAKRIKK